MHTLLRKDNSNKAFSNRLFILGSDSPPVLVPTSRYTDFNEMQRLRAGGNARKGILSNVGVSLLVFLKLGSESYTALTLRNRHLSPLSGYVDFQFENAVQEIFQEQALKELSEEFVGFDSQKGPRVKKNLLPFKLSLDDKQIQPFPEFTSDSGATIQASPCKIPEWFCQRKHSGLTVGNSYIENCALVFDEQRYSAQLFFAFELDISSAYTVEHAEDYLGSDKLMHTSLRPDSLALFRVTKAGPDFSRTLQYKKGKLQTLKPAETASGILVPEYNGRLLVKTRQKVFLRDSARLRTSVPLPPTTIGKGSEAEAA